MPGLGGFHQRTRAGRDRRFRVESLESRYMLSGEPVADFSLIDTNSTSATYEESVSPGRLLEVGCSFGAFLLAARARGWEVRGVDLSPFAAKACEEAGLDVFGICTLNTVAR